MKSLIVSKKDNNKKIVNLLMQNFNGLQNSTIYKALRNKDIKINNVRIHENVTVSTGDIVNVYIKDELLYKFFEITTVYEDSNIIIVNKPKNIEVISNDNSISLTSLIKINLGITVFPCHRLDRNTTGLVIFAKNEEALNVLEQKFKNSEIDKYYLCDVIGLLGKKQNTLEAYIFKDSKKSISYISDTFKPGYKKIKTSYKVIKENKNLNISTLEVLLHTGRTHQIRAHLSHIGHPIIGDGKYGINEINKKLNKKSQELLAYKIIFNFKTDSGILEYLNNKIVSINF